MTARNSTKQAAAHTPGPWEAPGTDGDEYVICASPKGKRRTLSHVYTQGDLHINAQANARRIVACVNACEGISTDALTTYGAHDLPDFALIDAQREQIAALREELGRAAGWMERAAIKEKGASMTSGYLIRIKAARTLAPKESA